LARDSFEFKLVAFRFLQTIGARVPQLNKISDHINQMMQTHPNGHPNSNQIQKIEKIFNRGVYEIFLSHLKIKLLKYKDRNIEDLLIFAYHGSGGTDPYVIARGEEGFDVRYARQGAAG